MTEKPPSWREMLRFYSVWALGLCGMIPLIWEKLPPEVLALIPDHAMPWVVAAVAILGIIGRKVPQ